MRTTFAQRTLAAFSQPHATTTETDVAVAVWRAAQDTSDQLRFPAGADAVALARRDTPPMAPPIAIG